MKDRNKITLLISSYLAISIALLLLVMSCVLYFRVISILEATLEVYDILLSQPQPELREADNMDDYEGVVREITAYNAGVEAQTDDTPCISADGTDICQALARGELICASNFVPMGTRLYVEYYGTCTVHDRMNKRYKNRVDVAFSADQIDEAKKFGRRNLMVKILE